MLIRRAMGAVVVGVAVLAAGCGGSGGEATPRGSGDTEEQSQTASTEAATVTVPASTEAREGGQLRYGLEAETDGWNPSKNRWAVSGVIVASTVFDPLLAYDETGRPQPYLARAISPNDAFTEWTIELREGVTFHDGTRLDAAAVKLALDAVTAGALTSVAAGPIDGVDVVDDLTVVVRMNTPWPAFPNLLTGQPGMIPAPAQLNDPTDASVRRPIGTGPFLFESWEPDNTLVVVRNDGYWREGLPLLDSVEFRPLPDSAARAAAIRSDDLDVASFNTPEIIADFRAEAAAGEVQIIEDTTETEEQFIMLNQAAPPFDDVRVRRAVAMATDRAGLVEVMGAGVTEVAAGPFAPDSPWYAESGFPEFDLAAATGLVEEIEAEAGPLAFTVLAAPKPENKEIISLLDEMWTAAGFDVEVSYVEQPVLISTAVSGNYQAALWKQYSAPDPDGEFHWWHSSTARPVGQLSLNIGRSQDAEIDAALEAGRFTLDREQRIEAYGDLQRRFGELVPYVWLFHAGASIVAQNTVHDIPNGPLPDGQPSLPFGGSYAPSHRLTQVWIER